MKLNVFNFVAKKYINSRDHILVVNQWTLKVTKLL